MNESTVIVIDNGHGNNTPGKRSPNWDRGVYYEYAGNRNVARHLAELLTALRVPNKILVPEIYDVPIPERNKRIKALGKDNKGNIFVISIHSDAYETPAAKGFSVFTKPGKDAADPVATVIYDTAKLHFPGRNFRPDTTDGDPDKEANFLILTGHNFPAVLVELFFMTNRLDYELLTSPSGPRRLAAMLADSILKARSQNE